MPHCQHFTALSRNPAGRFGILSASVRLLTILILLCALPAPSRAQPPDAAPPDNPSPPALLPRDPTTWWWLSGQLNVIAQAHGSFHSPYESPNSLHADAEHAVSRVLTLYTGARLPNGWEALVDIESAGGRGLSDALGLAGFTNLDVVRNPELGSAPYLARLMVRKIVALSPDEVAEIGRASCRERV